MKIQSIETFSTRQLCVVRVRTEDGLEGYGQTAPFNADITATILHRQIAPFVLGKDSNDIENITNGSIESQYKFHGSHICRAAGGIDTALWDLKGKREGKSVSQMIGGTRKYVDAYGSSMKRDLQPEEEADRMKRLMDTNGFRAFKLHICKPCGHNQDIWPGRTEDILPVVRKAIGEDTALYMDSNGCYTPERAIEMGKLFEEYGVGLFEEPCPFWEIEQTAEVKRALNIPVSGGEQDYCLAQWRRMIDMRAVDMIQPDICYIGGISRALHVAKMAEKAGLSCTPHSANLSMVTVFSIHMLAAIPNAGAFLEFTIEDDSWTKDFLYPALEVRDGKIAVPQEPGWGVTINKEWLEKADYKVSRID